MIAYSLAFQFTPLREGRRRWGQGRRSRPADFNSRPCERGDTAAAVDQERMNISIHAPARGATPSISSSTASTSDFNSRPCERGDRISRSHSRSPTLFQFTPLREGRRRTRAALDALPVEFQFTPLREGRPRSRHWHAYGLPISIHAPARGATDSAHPQQLRLHISIHAPARGATRSPTFSPVGALFQFTPLREGRRVAGDAEIKAPKFQFTPLREGRRTPAGFPLAEQISIHAPARGATRSQGPPQGGPGQFQFTPLREGRRSSCGLLLSPPYFNSRPCERGDRITMVQQPLSCYFNSRPCERGDANSQ